ncbi:hypothetical protein HG530_003369 [Fusarium avenaceum]|nr:hypothetical protein HG530_003369 [Fusarium avenaceum]
MGIGFLETPIGCRYCGLDRETFNQRLPQVERHVEGISVSFDKDVLEYQAQYSAIEPALRSLCVKFGKGGQRLQDSHANRCNGMAQEGVESRNEECERSFLILSGRCLHCFKHLRETTEGGKKIHDASSTGTKVISKIRETLPYDIDKSLKLRRS